MRRQIACATWVLMVSCSASSGDGGGDALINGGGSGNTQQPTGGSGGGGFVQPPPSDTPSFGCVTGCAFDVPPIIEVPTAGLPISADEISAFEAADPNTLTPGSLCVYEPDLGIGGKPGPMYPNNWLRPRFRWESAGGETVWEIRMTTAEQTGVLRAYTRDTQWIMPKGVWDAMKTVRTPVEVTIRGRAAAGAIAGVKGTFEIAPVQARGSMVFWATTSSYVVFDPAAPAQGITSSLQGFTVGDEGVVETLSAPQIATKNIPGENGRDPRGFYVPVDEQTGFANGSVECVGCHVSTPDGAAVVFTDNWPWNKVVASIVNDPLTGATPGAVPSYVTPGAVELLKQPWLGTQTFSPAHFAPGDRKLVTSYGQRAAATPWDPAYATGVGPTRHLLAWFNLEAAVTIPSEIPAEPPLPGQTLNRDQVKQQRDAAVAAAQDVWWGLIGTGGEVQSAVSPDWSNDGTQIVYVATDVTSSDGHPDYSANSADLKTVPYNNGAGGAVTPLAGASDPNFYEYYPAYSSDDAFIAFTRAPRRGGTSIDGPYYNRNGEINIVPRAGGAAVRLTANDPVSCSGETGQGIINSWPKWSPKVEKLEGKTYYFLTFSSARKYDGSFLIAKAGTTPSDLLNKSSQLYMATIVVDDATGAVETRPAIYLWNQNIQVNPATGAAVRANTSNLTPAWDDFTIPPVPPPQNIPR
jgi:hypothetical protein